MNSKYKMTSHDLNMAPETHAVRDERKNNSAYLACKAFTPNITYGCGGANQWQCSSNLVHHNGPQTSA